MGARLAAVEHDSDMELLGGAVWCLWWLAHKSVNLDEPPGPCTPGRSNIPVSRCLITFFSIIPD